MNITTKQRLIIVIVLSIILIGMMIYEVIRTELMKINYREVCLENGNRFCVCSERGNLLYLDKEDK